MTLLSFDSFLSYTDKKQERCKHRLRVMGAGELARRRHQAGWPLEDIRVPRGWHTACTTCLRVPGLDR